MEGSAPLVVVGRVRKPHGLKGEVAIFPLTDQPEAVYLVGRTLTLLSIGGDQVGEVKLETVRGHHRELLVRFANHHSREAVDDYRSHFLAMPRADLPPLGEGEVYQQDLVGYSVRDENGEPLGIVSTVYDLPAGVTIEVQGPKREFLLPFRGEYVLSTDTTERRLIVAIPAGLLD